MWKAILSYIVMILVLLGIPVFFVFTIVTDKIETVFLMCIIIASFVWISFWSELVRMVKLKVQTDFNSVKKDEGDVIIIDERKGTFSETIG